MRHLLPGLHRYIRLRDEVTCARRGYCGQLIAGSAEQPFRGALEILLSGDEYSESHACGGLKGRYLDVHAGAELRLFGAAPRRRWARLRSTADQRSRTLLIAGQVDWARGDELDFGMMSAQPTSPELDRLSRHGKADSKALGADKRLRKDAAPLAQRKRNKWQARSNE